MTTICADFDMSNQKVKINGYSIFYREQLKRITFGKGEDGLFYSKTSRIDRASLNIETVKTVMTEQTLCFWFHTYVDKFMKTSTLSV